MYHIFCTSAAEYLENGNNMVFTDLIREGKLIASAGEIRKLFVEDYSYLPYIKRLNKLKQRLLYLLEPYVEARAEELLEGELAEDISMDRNEKKVAAAMRSKAEFDFRYFLSNNRKNTMRAYLPPR